MSICTMDRRHEATTIKTDNLIVIKRPKQTTKLHFSSFKPNLMSAIQTIEVITYLNVIYDKQIRANHACP